MNKHTPESIQLQLNFEQTPVEMRFWAKVNKDAPGGCWLWTACKSIPGGYGLFRFEGRGQMAHRVAWKLTIGPIPDGLQVCHNCPGGDDPACVNPAHMFLGTQQDNILDCINKGRWHPYKPIGKLNPNNKLDECDIPAIRELAKQGVSYREIGRRYNVTHGTVRSICRYEFWSWIP